MKNKFSIGFYCTALVCSFLLIQCGTSKKSDTLPTSLTSKENAESIVLDTFADLMVLRYDLPGWDQLTLKQKTLIYYLSEATLAGRDIIYDQHCQYNLAIRKTVEAIYGNPKVDRLNPEWPKFETFAKRMWVSNGIHHHYNETKLPVDFSKTFFTALVKDCPAASLPLLKGEDAAGLAKRLSAVLFDPAVAAKRTNKESGLDIVQASAVNFYEGVTEKEVDAFYGAKLKAAGANPPMVGLNSKLVKENGQLVEKVWKVGGMYGPALEKICFWLEKAITVAENPQQAKAFRLLIEFYQTGDLKKFDAFNIEWVKDTHSSVDLINGFIEVYHDPKGYKADFESMVQYNDPDATEKMAIVSGQAQYFEDHSTIMPEHKKKKVTGVSYRVINVAMEGGDCAPSTPIGVNLPNSNWIREEYGSKSVSLNNIEEAYANAGGASAVAEFANDVEEVELGKKYGVVCDKMHTALHEVIGHASGKLNPGIPEPNVTLKAYSSTLEEARADLVALYFMPDAKLLEWKLLPDANAYKAEYDRYIRNGMLMQLRRIKPGDNIEEDHMRNRLLVSAWVIEKGKADKVIVKEMRNGKTYYDIRDYAKLRDLFGQLLREIQRIKSEGDYKSAEALVEGYGVKVDPETVKEVKKRFASLNTKPFSGFVQPKLVPVKNAKGEITDIKVEIERNFVQQMLRYGKDYSFLNPAP